MKLYPRRNASEKPIAGRFLCTLVGGLLALSTAYAAETTTPLNLQAAISNLQYVVYPSGISRICE